jgi:hypothetical protein
MVPPWRRWVAPLPAKWGTSPTAPTIVRESGPVVAPTCSFCGRDNRRGVAGPTLAIYICADCVALATQILDASDQADNPPDGISDA